MLLKIIVKRVNFQTQMRVKIIYIIKCKIKYGKKSTLAGVFLNYHFSLFYIKVSPL